MGTKITRRWKESSTDAKKMGRPAGTVQGRGWWGPLVRQRCSGPDPPGRVWVTGRGIAHYPHPLPFVKESSRAMKAKHLGQPGCGAAVQCWDCSRSLKSEPCGTVGAAGLRHPSSCMGPPRDPLVRSAPRACFTLRIPKGGGLPGETGLETKDPSVTFLLKNGWKN